MYTRKKAMEVYAYYPERALKIIDSAVIVGNMTALHADISRMRVLCGTYAGETLDSLLSTDAVRPGTRLDSARAIGQRLMRHDSIKTDLALQEDVLEMLLYTARQQEDTVRSLSLERQLVAVCHAQGAETEALRNEAEVGALLYCMGQQEQGMARLDSVLALLDDAQHFNELDALIIASKRKIAVLSEEGCYVEMLPLASRIVDRLNDYEQNPEAYNDSTYRQPLDSADRAEYIDFYRSQAQSYMTTAYAALGEHQSMAEAYEHLSHTVRDAAIREHLSRYHALEQQWLYQQAEDRSHLMLLISLASTGCLLIIIFFTVYIFYQNRRIKQRNRALIRVIDESIKFKEEYLVRQDEQHDVASTQPDGSNPLPSEGDASALSDAALFQYLSSVILSEQIYLDPQFDRQAACHRFGLTEHRVGAAFARGSRFGSLPAFIRDLRLSHACQLLRQHPAMPIGEVAMRSGFSNHRSFSTDFRRFFGLSPTEYRRQASRPKSNAVEQA